MTFPHIPLPLALAGVMAALVLGAFLIFLLLKHVERQGRRPVPMIGGPVDGKSMFIRTTDGQIPYVFVYYAVDEQGFQSKHYYYRDGKEMRFDHSLPVHLTEATVADDSWATYG
jgi:hypothetical protein